MSQSPTYYNAEAVRRVLNWPMVNEAVEAALKAVVSDTDNTGGNNATATNTLDTETELAQGPGTSSDQPYVSQPARNFTEVGEKSGKLLLTMPAFVGNYRLTAGGAGGDAAKVSTLACKLVTSFRGNNERQPPLPNIAANILLFNEETGELDAIMAGTDITTWRTVSASVVATKHLYFGRFGPRAEQQRQIKIAIIGCGVQGRMHAIGMCANFRVKQLNLYNRTQSRAIDLRNDLQETFARDGSTWIQKPINILLCKTPRDAAAQADVICVATYSRDPLIKAADLSDKRPIHINAVGTGEVHFGEVAADIYTQSMVYVDCMSNAEQELQGLPQPLGMHELGSIIIKGNYPSEDSLTIFQSMGMASEDACVAEAVQTALMSNVK